ncbi:MAG: fibrillarin-like rRNA/tRNA 2'-O-methyltransferase [Nanoarchaeota archaeon]
MINKSNIFEVYIDDKYRLYTINMVLGKQVYDERLITENNQEYREWNPKKSKLAALIKKGCNNIFIRKNDTVLYLGCSSGTTVSHVSDIVGKQGFIYALDFAPRMMTDMVFVAEDRPNIAPILADSNQPQTYQDKVSEVDIVYQDISQKNQVEIFLKNTKMYLKKGGYALLAIKARSVDITRHPRLIFNDARQKLEKEMIIIDSRVLDPFELDHIMFVCKNK